MPNHHADNPVSSRTASAAPDRGTNTGAGPISSEAQDGFGPRAASSATHFGGSSDNARHATPPTTRSKRSMRRQAAREARARRKQQRLQRKNARISARENRAVHPAPQYMTAVQSTQTTTVSTRRTSTDTKSSQTEKTVEEHTSTVTESTFAFKTSPPKHGWLKQELETAIAGEQLTAPTKDADLDLFSRTIARLASQALAWLRPAANTEYIPAQPLFGFIHQDVVQQFQEAPILGLTRLVSHHAGTLARPETPSEHPPLILIHGLAGSSGNFAPIRVWLSQHRPRPVHVFDYREYADMFPAADAFALWLDELYALYDEDIAFEILAHSMGGLITRLALRDAQRAARISHVLTLGTPHQGTRLATLGASTYLRQLQVDSPVFRALKESEVAPLPYTLTSIWTQRDILVLPAQHATLPGYASYAMHQSTHLSWLLHPQLIDNVFNILDAQRMANWNAYGPWKGV